MWIKLGQYNVRLNIHKNTFTNLYNDGIFYCCIASAIVARFSWGSSWGMNGYMYIARNVNMCGIALSATYPAI